MSLLVGSRIGSRLRRSWLGLLNRGSNLQTAHIRTITMEPILPSDPSSRSESSDDPFSTNLNMEMEIHRLHRIIKQRDNIIKQRDEESKQLNDEMCSLFSPEALKTALQCIDTIENEPESWYGFVAEAIADGVGADETSLLGPEVASLMALLGHSLESRGKGKAPWADESHTKTRRGSGEYELNGFTVTAYPLRTDPRSRSDSNYFEAHPHFVWLNEMRNAHDRIWISLAYLTDSSIIKTLDGIVTSKNIDVRLLLGEATITKASDKPWIMQYKADVNHEILKAKNLNVKVCYAPSGGYYHPNFTVIDGKMVIEGSSNGIKPAVNQNIEYDTLIIGEEYANIREQQHEQDWNSPFSEIHPK